jgi:hypothetical protein
MAMDAKFIKGDPRWSDNVPAADVTGGEVVIEGNRCLVCHSPGVAGAEMGMAEEGGIYELVLGATLAENAEVDFNNTTKRLVAAGAGDAYFGRLEPGYGGVNGDRRRAKHLHPSTYVA